MVWFNEQDLETTELVQVKLNKKQSGYILTGKDFDCFIWKNDILLEHLFVAMSTWIEQGTGYKILIKADLTVKRGFILEVQEVKGKKIPQPWYVIPDGFTTKTTGEELKNPFL